MEEDLRDHRGYTINRWLPNRGIPFGSSFTVNVCFDSLTVLDEKASQSDRNFDENKRLVHEAETLMDALKELNGKYSISLLIIRM